MSDLTDDPKTVAAKRGLDMVEPGPNDVFIDLDDAASRVVMDEMAECLRDNGIPVLQIKETVSVGGNAHNYLRIALRPGRPLTPLERVALQACLGSDRKRELLSLLRISLDLNKTPTVFFETPLLDPVGAVPGPDGGHV